MNGFTNAILSLLLGWLRSLFNTVWALLGSESSGTALNFLRENWKMIFLVMCVGGYLVDRIIYLIRWRPYYVWSARRQRRRQRVDELNSSPAPETGRYTDAYARPRYAPADEPAQDDYAGATNRYRPLAQPNPAGAYAERQVQAESLPTDNYALNAFAPQAQGQPYTGAPSPYAPPASPPYRATAYAPQRQAVPAAQELFRPAAQPQQYAAPSQPQPYAPASQPRASRAQQPDPSYRQPVAYRGDPLPFSPDASFAPTVSYTAVPFHTPIAPEPFTDEPRFDDDLEPWSAPQSAYDDFAPRAAPERNLAAGIKPVFGTPQPEPAHYLQALQSDYAPQTMPEQFYPPVMDAPVNEQVHPGLDLETFQQNIGIANPATLEDSNRHTERAYPDFTPFPVASQTDATINKPRGLGALAKKARSFVSGEDERNPRSIHDIQTSVDMKSAFHAPVYPKKSHESEEE